MIGYCGTLTSAEARQLSMTGFRGILPRTVHQDVLIGAVCAVVFGGTYVHDCYTNKFETAVLPVNDAPTDQLSGREAAVLRHLALGSSMKEIGTVLKISGKTVDTYKNRAKRKLNLRSRSDIVRYAMLSGWMSEA